MPNPFMRLGTPNQSNQDMAPDRPHPTPPIPENYEGTNQAYRGIETHGVPPTGKPRDVQVEYSDGTRPIVYDPPPQDPDPIPVKIVNEGPNERRDFRTRQSPVNPLSIAQQLVGANDSRTSVKFRNTHATLLVYISHDANIAAFNGYPLVAGAELQLNTESDVWALNPDATNTVTVAVLEEFSVEV